MFPWALDSFLTYRFTLSVLRVCCAENFHLSCACTLSFSVMSESLPSHAHQSIHGILQASILEWVAFSYSRASSWPRDQTCISCVGRQILYHCTTWEALIYINDILFQNRIFFNSICNPCYWMPTLWQSALATEATKYQYNKTWFLSTSWGHVNNVLTTLWEVWTSYYGLSMEKVSIIGGNREGFH